MSNEQFLAISAINPLSPNQFNPQNFDISWLEPFGTIPQGADKSFASGQLPLVATNLFQSNVSVLAGSIGQSADPFVSFTNYSANNFFANSFVTSWQFQPSATDKALAQEIDPVRQNIADSLQQPDFIGQPDSSLTQIIDTAQQQIASFFQQPDIAQQLALAFGQGVDPELAKSYSQQLPSIEVVPDSILGKANGAYAASTNTIFLAHSLVGRGDQQEIIAVLIEEIGHSIDVHLNTEDSPGDEGEIFAKLVSHHLDQENYLVLLAENDHSQILWQGQTLVVENSNLDFTIRAAGTVEIKGNSDLDGNPLILQDDALIYAGQGFSIKGNSILPVKRDINGNPLRDSQGKLILVDRAVAVSASYSLSETNNQGYGNLIPPQIVATQQIVVPSYSSLEQQYLTSKIANVSQVTFNANLSNTNNAAQWQQLFPTGGTTTQPRVIRVTGGDLNIASGVSLSNSIIIVENGDIDLRGSNQQFNNITLVTKNGDVLLGNVQANNLTVLAAGELFTSDNAKFNGNTLLATKDGDITFKGATTNLNSSQNLQVIAQGEINYSSNQATRGQFFSSDDFVANGNVTLYGTINSQRSVFLKGNTTIIAVPAADVTPPTITVSLVSDTGSNTTDKLTKDAGIKGQVTDPGGIAEFKVQLDGSATAIDLRSKLQADGTFNLTDAQVRQLVGNLPDGSRSLAFTSKDSAGNQSTFSLSFVLDTTAAAPGQLTLAAGSDSGVSATDGITKVKNPQITGTGEAGSIVSLFDGAQQVGQTTVGTNGTWQITTAPNLTDGQHQLTAKQTDIAGNVSSASPALAIMIDSIAPQLTLTAPGIIKNDGKLVGQILDSNLYQLTYQWDGGTAKSIVFTNGNFNQALDFTGIVNGAHSLTLTAVDKAGNITVTPYNVTVARDLVAPIINARLAIDSGSSTTDGITNNPSITGTVTDDNAVTTLQASFDGTNYVTITPGTNGNISLSTAQLAMIKGTALTDGSYNLRIKAVDQYGNASNPYSINFTLDTNAAAPSQLTLAASSDSGSSNLDRLTNVKNPKITGTGEAGSVLTLFDGTQQVGQTTVGADGTWQVTVAPNLIDGQHQLTAKQTDLAGNVSAVSPTLTLTLDSIAPTLTLGQPLDNASLVSNSRLQGSIADSQAVTASYSFAGGQTVALPINNGQFDAPFDFTGIADGSHQLTLTFTDAAGNILSRTYAINLSRGPLLTVALLNDTGASNSDGITTDVTIRGQVADRNQISRLEIALDGSTNYADFTFALQNDNSFQLSALQVNSLAGGQLSLGTHTLNVRTVTANGVTVGSSQLSFTLQATDAANVQLALAANNDSGPLNDGVTDAALVSLIAKAAPGSTLTLAGLNRTGVADATGQVIFDNIALVLGANNFTVTKDGQQQQFTFQRVAPQNVVLEWNSIALSVMQRDPYTPPPMFGRNLAMVQAAVYDAVNAISQRYSVYKVDINAAVGTSEEAAAAAAAARILSKLYPSQQAVINAALTRTLSTIADGAGKTAGIELGNNVADQIFAWRSKDGARTQVPYQNSLEVGQWQPTLPNFGGALYPQWPQVKPYTLDAGNQFRPNGLPSLNSAEYTAAYNEVNQLGARNSAVRTADQTQIAQFWSDGSGTYTPVGHWNQIAVTAASVKGTSLIETARLFAQLDVALADAGIAAWDAKYTYNTWRPITAIRDAGLDGNADTIADANWQPLIDTPPFPEYVSGHSTFSSAAAAVLGATFGDSFQFQSGTVTLPGVSRSFTSFTGAAVEAGQSRIYGGIHFQFANRDGQTLGKSIGDYVVDRFLIDETKGAIGVKLALDTAAFGSTNRDRVTKVADLTGVVRLDQPGLRLQIAQVGGIFTDVVVNSDKTFNLSASQLAAAIGTLTDKTYQLTLRLIDSSNAVVGSNNFSFTLDTTTPVIQIGDLTGASPLAHLLGSTDIGGAGRLRVDGGAWSSFALQLDGKFDPVISAAGLTAGLHQVEVQIADAADNLAGRIVNVSIDGNGGFYSSPATNSGWGQTLSNGFVLHEGNSLVTEKLIDVTFGGTGQRVLEFDLQTSFDGGDTRSFARDRVAFYLVDANGVPLSIDGQRPAGLPVFAYGESGTDTIPGLVQFDGTHVKIDVSGVNVAAGKLVVQLLNQDSDGRGNIKVTNFVDRLDAQALPGTAVNPYVAPANPGTAVVLDGYLGTTNGQLLLSDVSFDKATGKYSADLRVKNVGSTVLSRNLAVLLSELPAGVTVSNASGIHAAGSAYLNFATAIQAGGLAAGAISGAIRVEINDPNLKAFGFRPVVLQGAAEPIPDLTALRNLTVKVGDKLDFALDPSLALSISSSVNLPTGSITGDSHLVFTPAPNQVGTYEFTLIARNGSTETRQAVTLNVVADPITTTRVTGIVANTNQAGIAGVLVEFAGQQATTDAAGQFVIVVPNGAAGDTLKVYGQRIQGGGITYPFIAEKMSFMLGHDLYQGVNNAIDRPIYLPTVDISTGVTVNPNAQTIATNPNLVGAKVVVNPYSLYDKNGNAFTGTLTITEVPVNLTPAALPDNLRPDLVVTIQPGDMVFNTPALLTLPNLAGYAPGTDMDLWSINPNSGEFERVGLARVSKNGQVVETIEGGIRNSSWHFFAPPAPPGGPTPPPPSPPCESAEDSQDFNSQVSLNTGVVTETHDLVAYKSLGQDQSLSLTYSSLRADSRPIINFNFNGLGIVANNPSAYLLADLSVTDGEFTQKAGSSFWKLPTGNTGTATVSLLVDLRDKQSGRFDYSSNSGFNVSGRFGTSKTTTGKVINVNFSDSNFGAGWGIAGVQEIVENRDGSALLINGNGSEIVFEKPQQPNGTYQNEPGDLSKLVKLADGTFQRTTTDQTVYKFDSENRLVSVKDRLGKETKHVYNALGQLAQVIDPAGLLTSFVYGSNGKLATITDPVNRVTRMIYDEQGNLLKITDPTGATRTFSYDALHHMTGEVNPQGGVEQSFYDPISGRAIHSIRPDGSEIRLTPQQTIGLFDPELTKSISTAPYLKFTDADNVLQATYIDSNGNISYSKLDSKGIPVAASDAIGVKAKQTYDAKNQLISETDALGNTTNYVYDEKGNVIRKVQESSTAVNSNSIGSILTDFDLDLEPFGRLPDDINVEMADINHDGYQDAVILNKFYNNSPQEFASSAFASAARTSIPNGISIWFGSATGQFTAGDTYNFFNSNTSVNLRDLNGDDNVDMLIGRDQEALVYLGDGKGSFSQSATYNINSSKANTIGLFDVNGDGLDDTFYRDSSKFYLRLGRGIGEFGAALETDVDWLDFNGGGYGGAGVVAFAAFSAAAVSTPTALGQISTGDLDGDGKTDWLVATSQGFRSILNKGFCDYRPQTEVTQNANLTSESSVKLLDIDKDGDLDVLRWAPETFGVGLYLNSGNATFTFSRTISVGTSIRSITTTDFDGNDTIDLLVTGTSGTARILLGNTNGTFQAAQSLNSLPSNVKSIAVGDFDGYGLNDLLVFTPNGITLTPGWSLALQQSVRPGAVTSYTYDPIWNKLTSEVDPLGRKTLYEIDSATGNELSMTRVVGLVDAISSETNDVTTRYTYTAQGLIDTVTDALGRVSDNDYDLRGNLVRSIQAQGTVDESVITYEYDLAGNQTAMIDPLGRQTEYFYNQANLLVRQVQADPDGAGLQTAPVTEYQYDLMGHQVLMRDPRGNVTRYEYDQIGRMTKMIGADPDGAGIQVSAVTTYEYDLVGNQVAVVDPLGRRTTSIYDARNRLLATVDANGGKRQTIYDADNRAIGSIDANGNRSSSIYDAEGRVVREINALNQVRDTEFNVAGQVISTTDALGRKTRYQYDELGRQVALTDALGNITRTEYNKVGNTVAMIDANGNRTEFKYDALDRQIEMKDAQGGLTRTVYDKVGNTLSITDALNHSTTFAFDGLNRGIRANDALGHSTTSAFDAAGNLLGVTDALGRVTTYTYDALNRKIITTDVLGQTHSVAYDLVGNMVSDTNELGQVTSYLYDVLGRRTGIIDALGHTQTTTYDLEGNVRSTSDAIGNTTRYDYDALNRQVKVTDANNGITSTNYDAVGSLAKITDSVGNSTTYSYDAVNRLLTDTNQLGFGRRYGYDAVGNRVEMIDRNNRKTTYGYDSLNRRTGENWIGAGGVNVRSIGYTYDAVGNMITANDPDVKYTHGYDALNRIVTLDNTGTSGIPAVVLTYGYDQVGRLVSVGDRINSTNAGQTDYVFDQLNRVTKITQTGTGVQNKRVDMTYNKVNQMTSLSRFSDLGGVNLVAETSYTYDQNQRLIQLAHKKGVNNLASYNYTFDAANKLTKIVSSIDGIVDYAYDATNQLTGADHSSQTDEAYQYDANGNRTNVGYQTGTNNQLQADGQFTYEYDGEGNRTKRTEIATGKVTEYVWDYHNRLTAVLFKSASGVVEKNVEYVYDTNNLRIGKKIDGVVTERFAIDRNQIALVFDGSGVQKSRYLYGTQIDQVLAEESGAQIHWFLTDHQGTVKDVVDNIGMVSDHITYDSFGRIVGQTSPIELRFAYTGREWDGETGQYYYRARYYDAAVGKFISEDPIGFSGGDPNFYRYVSNSPMTFTDPSGKVKIEIVHNPLGRIKGTILKTKKISSPSNILGVQVPSISIPSINISFDTSVTHAFILVTDDKKCDSKSVPKEKYYRGGPLIQDFGQQLQGGDSGPIVTEFGYYVRGTIDYPDTQAKIQNQIRTLVYNKPGEAANRYDSEFRNTLTKISSGNFKYHIPGPNSNTVARQVLSDAGLPTPLPFGVRPPGWEYDFWSNALPRYDGKNNLPYGNLLPAFDNNLNPLSKFSPADLRFIPNVF